MGKALRSFGIGLFLAGAILFVTNEFTYSTDPIRNEKSTSSKEMEQLKQTIEEQQQIINALTEENEAFIQQTEQTNEVVDTAAEQTNDVTPITMYIYEGMSLYDIGKQAEDSGLVKVGRELELFLSKREYARSIQKGAFELHTNMTYEEMASILTGQTN